MDIDAIRARVQAGNYLVKGHVIQHALKEGFERKHVLEAVFNGAIVEEYPDDKRVLICGRTTLSEDVATYMHVVCEYADAVYVEFVTAYIPDELVWERPPIRRRRRKQR